MKLIGYFRSSAAYRVRIALNLKGMAPERVFVHLRRGAQRADDYLAVNPQGLVPALVTDGGDVLTQSLAIIEYVAETRPDARLWPADKAARAHAQHRVRAGGASSARAQQRDRRRPDPGGGARDDAGRCFGAEYVRCFLLLPALAGRRSG